MGWGSTDRWSLGTGATTPTVHWQPQCKGWGVGLLNSLWQEQALVPGTRGIWLLRFLTAVVWGCKGCWQVLPAAAGLSPLLADALHAGVGLADVCQDGVSVLEDHGAGEA